MIRRMATVAFFWQIMSAVLDAAIFVPLGDLAGGVVYSRSLAISADGTTIVGESGSDGGTEAFRWKNSVMTGLGDLSGGDWASIGHAVSATGRVVAGVSRGAGNTPTAFRWTEDGIESLGFVPGGHNSEALGISADGSVIVGFGLSSTGMRGFRWQSGVMAELPSPLNAIASVAQSVSADGSKIVGYSQIGPATVPTIWNQGIASVLPRISSTHSSIAHAISGNGEVPVGWAQFNGGTEAVRWINGLPTGIGDLAGGAYYSISLAASHDGTVIVGRGESTAGFEAFYWTEASGMLGLRDWLIGLGVKGLQGWHLEQANSVSGDGQVIVGWGINPAGQNEAWMVNLHPVPEPSTMISLLCVFTIYRIRRKEA